MRRWLVAVAGFGIVLGVPGTSVAAPPEGAFTLRSAEGSRCVERIKGEKAPALSPCNGSKEQWWQLQEFEDGSVALARGTKCLTVDAESEVSLRGCGDEGQGWVVVTEGQFFTLASTVSGSCLGTGLTGGVVLAACDNSSALRWSMPPVAVG